MPTLFDRAVAGMLPAVPKPVVRRVADRYIAGESLAEAVDCVRALNRQGAMATVDVLGEAVTESAATIEYVGAYHGALEAIAEERLDCNISIKLSALGLLIDPLLCRRNLFDLLDHARRLGIFVRVDMEDSRVTTATLDAVLDARRWYPGTGPVIQAYMRRSPADVERLVAAVPGLNVRLCKGIYDEAREIAVKDFDAIRLQFLALLDQLIDGGAYPAVATHDELLIVAAAAEIGRRRLPRERYEFQMLLGVDPQLRAILLDQGHRVRVYVPFGRAWYEYSRRRLRENPAVAGHVARAMLTPSIA
jgi:proline dehydrogenase